MAGLLLLFAGGLLIGATYSPWWYYSGQVGSESVSIYFLPGNDYSASVQNGSQSLSASMSYNVGGLGPVGGLYSAVFYLSWGAAGLFLVGGLVGLLAEAGLLRGRARGRLLILIGLLVFLLPLGTIATVAWEQPSLYAQANPGGACSSGSPFVTQTPCNSFWGSASASIATITWGSGAGWDLAVFSAVLALIAGCLWWSALYNPWELDTSWLESPRARFPGPAATGAPQPGSPAGYALPTPPSFLQPSATQPPAQPVFAASVKPTSGGSTVSPRVPVWPAGASIPSASRSTGGSPRIAPSTSPPPSIELPSTSEAGRLANLKQMFDAGRLSRDEFARSKASMLAAPIETTAGPAQGMRPPTEELATLDALRDAGALTGPEYLQFRRRILLRRS